jgi:hypothetical protein
METLEERVGESSFAGLIGRLHRELDSTACQDAPSNLRTKESDSPLAGIARASRMQVKQVRELDGKEKHARSGE